jgi:hypothetical protein
MYPNWAGIPALPRMAVAGVTAGAAEKVEGAVVVELELDAAGTADEVEDDVSFGSTNPEVWAVAPAATGSMIMLLIGLLIVVDYIV